MNRKKYSFALILVTIISLSGCKPFQAAGSSAPGVVGVSFCENCCVSDAINFTTELTHETTDLSISSRCMTSANPVADCSSSWATGRLANPLDANYDSFRTIANQFRGCVNSVELAGIWDYEFETGSTPSVVRSKVQNIASKMDQHKSVNIKLFESSPVKFFQSAVAQCTNICSGGGECPTVKKKAGDNTIRALYNSGTLAALTKFINSTFELENSCEWITNSTVSTNDKCSSNGRLYFGSSRKYYLNNIVSRDLEVKSSIGANNSFIFPDPDKSINIYTIGVRNEWDSVSGAVSAIQAVSKKEAIYYVDKSIAGNSFCIKVKEQ